MASAQIELPPAQAGFRQPMTLEDFRSRDWNNTNSTLKFEWSGGFVEAYEERMNARQRHIVTNLMDAFAQCRHAQEGSRLIPETDCYLEGVEAVRRPDLAAFTLEQRRASQRGDEPVPGYVVEIISPNDSFVHVEKKITEYFRAGVRVVWLVEPEQQLVRIFRSPTQVDSCQGQTLCTAAPAFPDFTLPAQAIFAEL